MLVGSGSEYTRDGEYSKLHKLFFNESGQLVGQGHCGATVCAAETDAEAQQIIDFLTEALAAKKSV